MQDVKTYQDLIVLYAQPRRRGGVRPPGPRPVSLASTWNHASADWNYQDIPLRLMVREDLDEDRHTGPGGAPGKFRR